MSGQSWVTVARSEDVTGPGPHAVTAEGIELVLVRSAQLRAFEGRCPHQGALLGEGELDGPTLVCRNHQWRFDAQSGRRQGGPQCLRSCPVEEREGAVRVEVSALRPAATAGGIRALESLPSPRASALLRVLFNFNLRRLHHVVERWVAELGPLYTIRIGPKRILVVADPERFAPAFRERPEIFRRIGSVETVFAEMGVASLFSAEGSDWRPQRKLAMEALAHRHLTGFYPTLRSMVERLCHRWQRAAAEGRPSELGDDFRRFTVDVTTLLTFGHDVNTLAAGEDVIQKNLELIFPAFHRRISALVPYWRWFRLPQDRRLDRALHEVQTWLATVIDKTRERLDPARPPANFLEAMLTARDDEGRPFSEATLFGNALGMLLAGEDTTANTLAWAVHELCDRPEVFARLRAEADEVLGNADVAPDLETANRLVYALAVAQETLRLRPVAPLLFTETNCDTTLGNLALKKGQLILLLLRPPGLDESRFHHAREFRPERWLRGAQGPHDAAALVPFGSGPRLCPGRSLALTELRVVLSALARNFDLARVGAAADVQELFQFTLQPTAVEVRLARRDFSRSLGRFP